MGAGHVATPCALAARSAGYDDGLGDALSAADLQGLGGSPCGTRLQPRSAVVPSHLRCARPPDAPADLLSA